jgi:hypothetical protein
MPAAVGPFSATSPRAFANSVLFTLVVMLHRPPMMMPQAVVRVHIVMILVMVHWPAMMVSQAVVRVHVVLILVRRVMLHRCFGNLAERRSERKRKCDKGSNESTFQAHGRFLLCRADRGPGP